MLKTSYLVLLIFLGYNLFSQEFIVSKIWVDAQTESTLRYFPDSNHGEVPNWMGNLTERGMAFHDGKLYIVSRKVWPHLIIVLDAASGNWINSIEIDMPITFAGSLDVNDIAITPSGKILVANLSTNVFTQPFRVYLIEENGEGGYDVRTLLSYNSRREGHRIGDGFAIFGDIQVDQNAYIIAGDANGPSVFRWDIFGGIVNQEPKIIYLKSVHPNLSENSTPKLGVCPRIQPIDNEHFWADGHSTFPTLYNMEGEIISKFSGQNKPIMTGISGVNYFSYKGYNFILAPTTSHLAPTQKNLFQLFRIPTEGAEEAESIAIFPERGLGHNPNPSYASPLAVDVQSDHAIMYMMSPNNGIAAYRLDILGTDIELKVFCTPTMISEVNDFVPEPCLTISEFLKIGEIHSNCPNGIDSTSLTFIKQQDTPIANGKEIIRTYTLADNCGNVTTCEQKIIVIDFTPPEFGGLPTNFELTTCEDIPVGYATLDDFIANGGIAYDISGLDTSTFAIFDKYLENSCPVVITRTYEISDIYGNVSVFEQTFVVYDNQPPTITCLPDEIFTYYVNSNYPKRLTLNEMIDKDLVNDNCGISPSTFRVQGTWEYLDTTVLIKYTYNISDFCGNTAVCTHQLEFYSDNESPSMICLQPTIFLDKDEQYQVTLDDVLGEFSDNYTPKDKLVINVILPLLTQEDIGKTMFYTLTISDESGNISACLIGITVKGVETNANSEIDTASFSVSIYPNPTKGTLHYELHTPMQTQIKMEIIDISGKVHYSASRLFNAGLNTENVQLSKLTGGLYFLRVSDGQTTIVEKFVLE